MEFDSWAAGGEVLGVEVDSLGEGGTWTARETLDNVQSCPPELSVERAGDEEPL